MRKILSASLFIASPCIYQNQCEQDNKNIA